MYGAILGDMIGSPFEFDRGGKTKEFTLFCAESEFTDDTVMTLAMADALMDVTPEMPDEQIMERIIGMLGNFCSWVPTSMPPGKLQGLALAQTARPITALTAWVPM